MRWWRELRRRWKEFLVEYGSVAFGVWFAIFGLVLGGFVLAIEAGFQPEGVAAESGKWGMAYVATQLTKPIRIVATMFLTPVVARVLRRRRGPDDAAAEEAAPGGASSAAATPDSATPDSATQDDGVAG